VLDDLKTILEILVLAIELAKEIHKLQKKKKPRK